VNRPGKSAHPDLVRCHKCGKLASAANAPLVAAFVNETGGDLSCPDCSGEGDGDWHQESVSLSAEESLGAAKACQAIHSRLFELWDQVEDVWGERYEAIYEALSVVGAAYGALGADVDDLWCTWYPLWWRRADDGPRDDGSRDDGPPGGHPGPISGTRF